MSAHSKFNVGDPVYFRKYERAELDAEFKVFKPGAQANIVSIETRDNVEGFVIENKKGVQGFVVASELKMRPRPLKEQIQEAMTKQQSKKSTKAAKVEKTSESASTSESDEATLIIKQSSKEDAAILKLMTASDGSPQHLMLTEELDRVLIQEQSDPLQVAKDLWRDVNASYYDLGGTLAYIFAEKKHRDYGYTGANAFNKFVDAEFPNMKNRKARYLLEIYVRFTNLGVNKEDVLDLGWTLAANIASVATHENVYELIQYAKEHGGEALKVFIQENYRMRENVVEQEVVLRPAEVGKLRHVTLSIYEDQFKIYESAIEHVKTQYPEYKDKPSQLFAALISEYMSNVAMSTGMTSREDYVAFGESAFADHEVLLVNRKTRQVFNPRYNQGEVSVTIAPTSGQTSQVEALA